MVKKCHASIVSQEISIRWLKTKLEEGGWPLIEVALYICTFMFSLLFSMAIKYSYICAYTVNFLSFQTAAGKLLRCSDVRQSLKKLALKFQSSSIRHLKRLVKTTY